MTELLEVFAPASGEKIGEVPVHDAAHARDVVARVRAAQSAWAEKPAADRARVLRRVRDAFFARADDIAALVARENGKAAAEAILHDVAPVTMHLTWLAARGVRILAPSSPKGLAPFPRATQVHHRPHGVVLVVSPWNFPVTLPFSPTVEALMAGNGVVIKPSEHTPLVCLFVRDIFVDAGIPAELLQVVTGGAATGAALIDAGVDFVHFTGSTAAGRKVAAACGERLIPHTLELGGKAPLVVMPDADLERAAGAIVFGGFANAGQICISVERVLVPDALHDALVARVVELVRELRQGDPERSVVDVGAMTMPGQLEIVEGLVADARERGARVLCGGERLPGPGRFLQPTVVVDVTPDMPIARAEIFGPAVAVLRYHDLDEALAISNSLPVGLSAYVFGDNREKARAFAEQLRVGTVAINDVFLNYAVPELPFGGVGDSGYGRSKGPEGLLAMTWTQSVADDRASYRPARDPWWFPYSQAATDRVTSLLHKALKVFDLTSRR